MRQFRGLHIVPYPTQSQPSPLAGPPAQVLISLSVAALGSSDFDRALSIMNHSRASDLEEFTQDTRLQPGIYHEGPEG